MNEIKLKTLVSCYWDLVSLISRVSLFSGILSILFFMKFLNADELLFINKQSYNEKVLSFYNKNQVQCKRQK